MIKDEPQMRMGELLMSHPELEDAIETILENAEAHKEWAKSKRRMKKFVATLEPGFYRIGRHQVEISVIEGGDINIPFWRSKMARIIAPE